MFSFLISLHFLCFSASAQKPNQLFWRPLKSDQEKKKKEDKSNVRNSYTAQELLDEANRQLEKNQHTKALDNFTMLRNYFRDDPLSIEAELGIAEVYKDRGDYDLARFAFDDFRKLHPRHPKLDYVEYQIGLMQYQKSSKYAGRDQSWTQSAISIWNNYENIYPNSTHKEDVLEIRSIATTRLVKREFQIATFYKKRKAWESVRRRSEFLIRNYPNTDYKQETLILLVEAYTWQKRDDDAKLIIDTLATVSEEAASEAQKKHSSIQNKRD
jgi:outer membrane protein assembly factor BamD